MKIILSQRILYAIINYNIDKKTLEKRKGEQYA